MSVCLTVELHSCAGSRDWLTDVSAATATTSSRKLSSVSCQLSNERVNLRSEETVECFEADRLGSALRKTEHSSRSS